MRIISPQNVEPMINEGYPPEVEGKIFHRRVFSALEGGPKSIDIDYNSYAGGLGGRLKYAYTKDEFCYTVKGLIRTDSRGVIDDAVSGTFMWRPAGTITDGVMFMEDSISICAFAPAREDEWGHRLAPEVIDEWDGDEATRSTPIFRHFSTVTPTPYPNAPDDDRITFREIFSEKKDSCVHMNVSYLVVSKGVVLKGLTSARDEIWWLESGALELSSGGEKHSMKSMDFFFCQAHETIDEVDFTEDAVIISYSAPTLP